MMKNKTVGPVPAALTDSRLAALCAQAVQSSFIDYEKQFHRITRRGPEHFLIRDWAGSFADSAGRLHLYTNVLDDLTRTIRNLMGPRLAERGVWAAIKAVYSSLIVNSPAWEIAESFFNSLTRRVFATEGVDQSIEFVDTDFDAALEADDHIALVYTGSSLDELLIRGLTDSGAGGFAQKCWNNLPGSALLAAKRLETAFGDAGEDVAGPAGWRLELIRGAFYRGRGAYYVGCLSRDAESAIQLPIALCLRHPDEDGITLDAVLHGETDLAVLFSYTRAYFRVEAPHPHQLVRYLGRLMPRKRRVDLYNAIGFHRHGKTEFYRDFVAHLRDSTDQFTIAQGVPGMVMLVFTLPSYDVVFKLIKDRFDFPKDTTREEVMRRYRLVFEHDRAGRLVEAHEFEHLRIPRERFDAELLKQLQRDAGEMVRLEGDDVVIGHAYVERRIQPLNLFLADENSAAVAAAACDYGLAIKDLAASNIFPGDLLTKNFGVTRTGRVVFYDYDELCFLTDCNFRDLPESRTYEEEISAEPWFSVRKNDVFPEEFPRFLSLPGAARQTLLERHGDLFQADFWRDVQQKLRAGEVPEIFPYAAERRLDTREKRENRARPGR